jgi:uncharacterized protein YjbI with pentapeptide repeats
MKHYTYILTGLVFLFTTPALSAQAQIRVDARMHASSGSCSQCDLSNKRMNGVKLKNADFTGSIFNNSNLSGGQIDGSNLTGAHFKKALLYRIEGQKVRMDEAVFEDATLTEANVTQSVLRQANLRRADLSRGQFQQNDFSGADLESVKAPDVNFRGSIFEGAHLDHMNLDKAILDESKMKGASFGYALMSEVSLKGTDLSDAKLANVQGLKQEQLDPACGNMNTELPSGLSISYCEGSLDKVAEHNHDNVDPKFVQAAIRLDRAIKDVEFILDATPKENGAMRKKLESIHSDLVSSKRVIEK